MCNNRIGKVYSIDSYATLKSVYYRSMDEANPWRYKEGGTLLEGYENIDILYEAGLSNDEIGGGLTGGTHNAATVDLSFLGPGTDFTSHFTMQCGNDNLMGNGAAPVPEPATMVLFGIGLIGIAGFGRKKFAK